MLSWPKEQAAMTQPSVQNPVPQSAGSDQSQLRPGEIAVALPEVTDAGLYFIGRIRTPWTSRKDCPKNVREARERGAICTVEVDSRWSQALAGVETCSHLILLYWMDRARRDLVIQRPAHYDTGRATFSLRSPVRPNPIALAVVKLVKVEGTRLSVIGPDCLDGTPLLDIKPYFASTDSIPEAEVGWHTERKG
jgi:tRNA-Thr(GGU) m(6)t(6)A37 methyltransferase TsaA